MSKRIGELLVEKRLLTPAQLDQALKAQLIFGGHLGTNLIELGFLDEAALGQGLSELLRLPYAPRERFEAIPADALATLSREQVERHKVIPLRLEENALSVAVIHPKHLGRLSTLTGLKIVPHVAPEIRIYQAMEKYYDVPRRPRYVTLCHELDRGEPRRPVGAPNAADAPAPAAAVVAPRADALAVPTPPPPSVLAQTGDAVSDVSKLGEEYGYGRHWREVLEEAIDTEARAKRGVPPPRAPGGLARLAQRLGAAETKEDLAAAALDFATETLSASILFGVRSQTAFLWDWRGLSLDPACLKQLRFPVTAGSIFTALLGRDHYRGPVPHGENSERFYGALGSPPPNEMLLVPVYLDDRLVAVLYGEESRRPKIRGETERFLRMAEKLSLAMSMLILKMKIRKS